MKILVDADACPVKNIIVSLAQKYQVPVTMVCDTSHIISDAYSTIITVDQFADSADLVIVNNLKKGDIVVTQDYGLACLVISKKAFAINQNGLIYNNDNIDRMLFERFLSKKTLKAGGKLKNIHKRSKEQNKEFKTEFEKLLKEVLDNATE